MNTPTETISCLKCKRPIYTRPIDRKGKVTVHPGRCEGHAPVPTVLWRA